jgi:hypothetical protein
MSASLGIPSRLVAGPIACKRSSRAAVVVQANKLIKGANRPVSRKNSSTPSKKSQSFEINLQRLCKEPDYLPARQIGPVDVAVKSGETVMPLNSSCSQQWNTSLPLSLCCRMHQ